MGTVFNGMYRVDGHRQLCNAHLSYKGRSIIIDYEWCLHLYEAEQRVERLVPFEVYPYRDDTYVGFVHTDSIYKKADLGELISILDEIIENEDKYTTPMIEDDYEDFFDN